MKSENEKKLKIINPATNHLIKQVAQDSDESIRKKFESALKSQKKWAQVDFRQKKKFIENFKKLLIKNKERLAQILTLEVGKPITQSLNEINGTIPRLDFFLKNTQAQLKEIRLSQNEKISWEPLGVIANISAWNYPYFVGSNVFIPALLTGNAVLYKPSEFATLTGLEISNLLIQSGIPKEVFVSVVGDGPVGAKILDLPINGVFFTGSHRTGILIAQAVAKKLIKVQLELGGKDPVYVCDDVDPKMAALAIADGAMYNTGQSCCSVERVYVHQKIYDCFVKEFVDFVKSFKVGDPTQKDTYIGPLTRSEQIKVLEDQISDALNKGATIAVGGHRIHGSGNYFEPTVLLNVTNDMKLMREESFGPIIGIMKVKNDAEAIELMNDTEYGLTSSVYSNNKTRAHKILAQLNSGTVYWNCCDRVRPYLPWSGRKNSGIGSTLGLIGIQTFLQPKAWHG